MRRITGHPAVRAMLTALAFLIVYLALTLPHEVDQLTPAALVRIPVELLLGVAVLLVLPPRIRHAAALVGGAALGLLTILKVLDMGFLSLLGRPFDPVFDWVLLGNAREFVEGSFGSAGAIGAAVAAVVLVVVVVVATALATLRIARVAGRHRPAAAKAVAVLSVAWVACLALGAQLVAPVPVASRSAAALAYEKAGQVPASLRDERVFAAQAADDAFRATPPDELLTGLRGKDVVFTFVESYGRSAVEDPRYAPVIDPLLDAGTARLAAAGYGAQRLADVPGGGRRQLDGPRDVALRREDRQPEPLPQPRHQRPDDPRLGVPPGGLRDDQRHAGHHPGLAGGRLLRHRPGARRPEPGLPRPRVQLLADARPVRPVGVRAPGARPDRSRAGVRAGRADLQPRAVDAVPEAGRMGRRRRRLGVRAAGRGPEPTGGGPEDDDRVRAVYRDSTAYSLDTLSPTSRRTATTTWC